MTRNITPTARSPRGRPGFTMLELLITTAIFLILMAITVTAIRVNNDADRVRGAARQIQSYLLGARDRAIYANAPRGVRFLLDPNSSATARTISSLVYVEPTPSWLGQVEVFRPLPAAPMIRVRQRLTNTSSQNSDVRNWPLLTSRGQLAAGLRIKIPASSRGNWYVIQAIDTDAAGDTNPVTNTVNLRVAGEPELVLTTEYRTPNTLGQTYEQAEIELPPTPMPNTEPVKLPRNVVIDIERCRKGAGNYTLPLSWAQGGVFTNRMDLMFSPRGVVSGPTAAKGIIHFYITEQAAADIGVDPSFDPAIDTTQAAALPTGVPDKVCVTVFTRTGTVIASPILTDDFVNNATGLPPQDRYADDPFRYAESGEIAGR